MPPDKGRLGVQCVREANDLRRVGVTCAAGGANLSHLSCELNLYWLAA